VTAEPTIAPPPKSPPAAARPAGRFRRLLSWRILGLALGAAAVGYLIHVIGWPTIVGTLRRIEPRDLLWLGLVGVAETVFDGLAQWAAVTRLGGAGTVGANALCGVVSVVAPWDSYELLKVGLLSQRMPPGRALSGTIVANYVVKIARPIVVMLAALVGLIGDDGTDARTRQLVVACAALSFVPYLLIRVVVHRGAVGAVIRIAGKLPLLRRASARFLSLAKDVDTDVRRFWWQHRADWMLVLFFQCAGRAAACLTVYLALRALGVDYSFSRAALIFAAVNVADFLITLSPSRIGVAEGAAFLVFKLLALDPASGAIMYVVLRLKSLVANGLVATLSLAGARRPPGAVATPADTSSD
jgi:uncharacterized membrane protein YbhN (UPF0104 family)